MGPLRAGERALSPARRRRERSRVETARRRTARAGRAWLDGAALAREGCSGFAYPGQIKSALSLSRFNWFCVLTCWASCPFTSRRG